MTLFPAVAGNRTKARIMAVTPGKFTASGTVTWQKNVIRKLESSPFELPGRQSLGEGVEIPRLNKAESGREGGVGGT